MKTVLRFFISTAAVVATFVTFAHADDHKGSLHSVSGELRTRYEGIDNIGLQDVKYEDGFYNRARINFDVMPTDNTKVRITPQAEHVWSTTTNTSPNLYIKEAWMAWMPTDMISIYVGRQKLEYGNGQVIGSRDWDNFTDQAFDAARVRFSFDYGDVDVLWSKLEENPVGATQTVTGAIAPQNSDADLLGLYGAFNLEDQVAVISDLDVYGLIWWDTTPAGDNDNKYYILGARVDGGINIIDYNLEGTAQFGELAGTDSLAGFFTQLDVGATFMDKHRVGGVFAYANNEYVNLLGNYQDFQGKADVIGRRNIVHLGLLADLQLTDMIDAHLGGHYFMRAKTDFAPGAGIGTGTVTGDATSSSRNLGLEIDGNIGYQPEDSLKFLVGYNGFFGSGYLKDAENLSEFYVQGKVTF